MTVVIGSNNVKKSWLGFFEILWWHNDIGSSPDELAKWQYLLGEISNWKIIMQYFVFNNIRALSFTATNLIKQSGVVTKKWLFSLFRIDVVVNIRVMVYPVYTDIWFITGKAGTLIYVGFTQQSSESWCTCTSKGVQLRLITKSSIQTRIAYALIDVDTTVRPGDSCNIHLIHFTVSQKEENRIIQLSSELFLLFLQIYHDSIFCNTHEVLPLKKWSASLLSRQKLLPHCLPQFFFLLP